MEAFEIFGSREDLESCGDLSQKDPLEDFENWSDCEPDSCARGHVVPDVTDVLVSLFALIGNLWNRSALCCADKQEEMRYEGSPVKASPFSRRRMTPPARLF